MTAKALLLAAGKSTRIAQVADHKPKVLLEVSGKPVLFHNLNLLESHGVREVYINLHYGADQIAKAVGKGEKWNLSVQYSHEKELLGTSGALKALEKKFTGSDFFVLYGDNYTDCNLMDLMNAHKNSGAAVTLALFDPAKTRNSGIAGGKVAVDKDGFIKKFKEGKAGGGNLVNSGIYAVNPSVLKEIPEGFSDFGKDIFPALLAKGQNLFSFLITGFCYGIDTPEAFANAPGARA